MATHILPTISLTSPTIPLSTHFVAINQIMSILALGEEVIMDVSTQALQFDNSVHALAPKCFYETVEVHSNSKNANLSWFAYLIQKNPSIINIAQYIRTLHITLSQRDIDDHESDLQSSLQLYQNLSESSSSIPNLQILRLSGTGAISWGPLFHSILMIQSLLHVELWNFRSIPFGDIALATHIQSLELYHVSFKLVPDFRLDSMIDRCWVNLETLKLCVPGLDMRMLQIPGPLINLGHLKTLKIEFAEAEDDDDDCDYNYDYEDIEGEEEEVLPDEDDMGEYDLDETLESAIASVTDFFKAHYMYSLESLQLSLVSWFNCPIRSTDLAETYNGWILPCRATLKHLKTSTVIVHAKCDPYSGLIPTLESLRRQNVLELLEMTIIVPDPFNFPVENAWYELTSLLVKDGWHHLRKVTVNFDIKSPKGASMTLIYDINELLSTYFEHLLSRRFIFALNLAW